jgi:hypothetical protein
MMRVTAGTFVRPLPTEKVAGDACHVDAWARGVVVAVADGLGHGPAAAAAAGAFVDRIRASRSAPLPIVLEDAHRALLKTRGAVAAIARFDELARRVEIAGLGNVSVLLASGSSDARPIVMPAGVLGSAFRPVRAQVFDFGEGDILIMHTDGVQGRLSMGSFRMLAPAEIARAVVAMHGKATDDAGCAVAIGTTAGVSARPDGSEGNEAVTLDVRRSPSDGERCAAEGRRFAAAHGFSVMAQWQIGIAISEIVTVLRGAPDARVLLRFASDPRDAIVLEVACPPGGRPIAPAELGSVQRMMDRIALEPNPSGPRLRAWKHRG